MSPTAETTGKTKSRSQPKSKAERAEINRRNSLKSTGPRTADGKRNSKFNAVTHGLTARTVLLPGEDAAALAARQQHLIDAYQPRNSVELAVIESMAGDMWKSSRAELAAGLRISARLRHEPHEQTKKERHEAVELGGRLFWQLSFPLPISKRFPVGKLTEPLCSENPVHPHHPARIKLRLEDSIPGCDWLIDAWDDLMLRLYRDELWLSADPFKMVRLLGKHAIDMVDDLTVARVFLYSVTLISGPQAGPERESFDWQNVMIKTLITFDVENKRGIAATVAKQCEPFARRLAELPLAKLAPRDEAEARARLTAIIEAEVRRLRDVRQTLQEIADADAAEAPGRLAFEIGPEGDRHRRYGQANERQVIKRFGDFLKTRTMSADGIFDPVEFELPTLLGTDVDQPETCDADAQAPAPPPHPACGRPLPEGRGEADHVSPPTGVLGTADRPRPDGERVGVRGAECWKSATSLETDATTPEFEAIYDDDCILRNEANVDCEIVRNEANADCGAQETEADTTCKFAETGNDPSCRPSKRVALILSTSDRENATIETKLDRDNADEWIRIEAEERKARRAERLRKLNEESRREADAAWAARHSPLRRIAPSKGQREHPAGARAKSAP